MPAETDRKTVRVSDIQPLVIEGLRSICDRGNFDFIGGTTSLPDVRSYMEPWPDIWVVDNNFGCHAVHAWIRDHNTVFQNRSAVIVWGIAISEREVFEYTKTGSKGVIRKTAPLEELQACLAFVAAGRTWVEAPSRCSPKDGESATPQKSARFTEREQQMVPLLQQGFTTRRIASELGMSYCTAKIHLNNIYHKAGVGNRYSLLNSILVSFMRNDSL